MQVKELQPFYILKGNQPIANWQGKYICGDSLNSQSWAWFKKEDETGKTPEIPHVTVDLGTNQGQFGEWTGFHITICFMGKKKQSLVRAHYYYEIDQAGPNYIKTRVDGYDNADGKTRAEDAEVFGSTRSDDLNGFATAFYSKALELYQKKHPQDEEKVAE